MIIQENIIIGNKEFIKTYSDKGLMIKQVETGAEYSEAVDVIPCKFSYVETDKPIEVEEEKEENVE